MSESRAFDMHKFANVDEAIAFIKAHLSGEAEIDINGDVFFGLGYVYTWSDVAEKAGIPVNSVIPLPGTDGTVTNTAFHHFRNDDELRRVLGMLLKEYRGLLVTAVPPESWHRPTDSTNMKILGSRPYGTVNATVQ